MEIESAFHPASTPDYLPPVRMRELQLERLRRVVRRAYANVPLFRGRLEERGFRKTGDRRDVHDIESRGGVGNRPVRPRVARNGRSTGATPTSAWTFTPLAAGRLETLRHRFCARPGFARLSPVLAFTP